LKKGFFRGNNPPPKKKKKKKIPSNPLSCPKE